MFKSAVQLTFPCPACGSFLTLRRFRAAGPCPSCGTHLDVALDIHQGAPAPDDPHGTGGRRFADRRFRPVAKVVPAAAPQPTLGPPPAKPLPQPPSVPPPAPSPATVASPAIIPPMTPLPAEHEKQDP